MTTADVESYVVMAMRLLGQAAELYLGALRELPADSPLRAGLPTEQEIREVMLS